MEKMYVSLEGSNNEVAESSFAAAEPIRSKAAIASYRCKLYRAQLDQSNSLQNPAPQLLRRLTTAGKAALEPVLVH
jgi:hypothetical protein